MPDMKLNQKQGQAVKHGDGPLLVIAGAGTGKTTVISERIKHLIASQRAQPSEILALTFTEKAAREMEERVDVAVPYGYTQMWISTFHAFCDRVLRQEALAIGLPTNYRLLRQAEAIQLIRNNLFSFDLQYFRPLGNPTKFIGGMLQHFSRLGDEDVLPADYLAWASSKLKVKSQKLDKEEVQKYLELAKAYRKYQELKVKEGVMDFADLISCTLVLFRKRPAILQRYRGQFKYILVDEFQDTNYAQNELAILLAGRQANITAVADDDQSIYRFRGAAVSNVLQFRKHFPTTKIVTLVGNYRSTQEILDRSYQLIRHNDPDRLEVKEHIDKKLISQRPGRGERVRFLYEQRVEDEAEQVVGTINRLVEQQRPFSDFAVLVRANNSAEPFIRALSRAGIPYQFLGPGQLFRQDEVKDLIAYLKVLDNFDDSVSLYRVLSMDHFGLSARDLSAIANWGRRNNLSLYLACEQVEKLFVSPTTKQAIQKFVGMVTRHLKLARRQTAGQLLYYFLQETELLASLLADPKDYQQERRARNVSRFFDKLKTYEVEHDDASVRAVVDWLELSMELGESPLAADSDWTDINAVNIITIHSAKGLEFPVVFLVNLVAGRFPTYERSEQIPIPDQLIREELPVGDFHLEEERRLCYVGMTRAKDLLYLTSASYYGEGKRERKVSQFVQEALGEDAVAGNRHGSDTPNEQLTLLGWAKQDIPETPPTRRPPITYLSYSQIQEFRICPLHYKLKYHIGIPTPPSAAQSFGITMHKTMADFYLGLQGGNKGTLDQLVGLYRTNWIAEGYASKKHELLAKRRGQDYLNSFFKTYYRPGHLPILVEHPFSFRLGALKIAGKIDRVDQTSTGIEIIDYKTGTTIPTAKDLATDLQLTVYALAAVEVREKPLGVLAENITLSLYSFEEGRKLTTTRTKEQLQVAREELLRVAEEIGQSDFTCSGSYFCQRCEYRMFCNSL